MKESQPTKKIKKQQIVLEKSYINNPEINNTLRVSLNSKISSTSTRFIFANQIPMMVTVNKPDSWAMIFEPSNAPNIKVKTAVLTK